MSDTRSERERRREERLAAQKKRERSEKLRRAGGTGAAALLVAIVVGGLIAVIAFGGEDSVDTDDPHVFVEDRFGGTADETRPDDREPTEPPAQEIEDMEEAAEAAGCELSLDLDNEGQTHLREGTPIEYETQPPTSGDHYLVPFADGAFIETPPLPRVVHTLEHGRVAVQYSSDLPEDEQLILKGLFEEDPGGMLLFPNDDMPSAVAVAAWQQKVTCEEWSPEVVDAVRTFRDEFRGRGPEPVAY